MSRWKNSCECYYWVYDHPKLQLDGCISPWIEITPHMVDPVTQRIEPDEYLNTKMRFWVECGEHINDETFNCVMPHHDSDLDCGGWTWEEAVFNLGNLVLNKYGDYDDRN